MAEQIEHFFGQLDFTEVTSDILYDYGMDFFNWRLMHGKYLNDSIVVSAGQWGYLCFQASSSGVNEYDPVPDAAPYFAWANKLPSEPDTVALVVWRFVGWGHAYQRINTSATRRLSLFTFQHTSPSAQ